MYKVRVAVPRTPYPVPRTPYPAPRTPHPAPRTPHPAPRTPYPVPVPLIAAHEPLLATHEPVRVRVRVRVRRYGYAGTGTVPHTVPRTVPRTVPVPCPHRTRTVPPPYPHHPHRTHPHPRTVPIPPLHVASEQKPMFSLLLKLAKSCSQKKSEQQKTILDDLYIVTCPDRARTALDTARRLFRLVPACASLLARPQSGTAGGVAADGLHQLSPDARVWFGDPALEPSVRGIALLGTPFGEPEFGRGKKVRGKKRRSFPGTCRLSLSDTKACSPPCPNLATFRSRGSGFCTQLPHAPSLRCTRSPLATRVSLRSRTMPACSRL